MVVFKFNTRLGPTINYLNNTLVKICIIIIFCFQRAWKKFSNFIQPGNDSYFKNIHQGFLVFFFFPRLFLFFFFFLFFFEENILGMKLHIFRESYICTFVRLADGFMGWVYILEFIFLSLSFYFHSKIPDIVYFILF